MNTTKLKGAVIGFIFGMVIGVQMCSSSSEKIAPIAWDFGFFVGLPCAIIGALVAKDKEE